MNSQAMQHSSWSSGHRDERTRRTRSLNKQQPIIFTVWNEPSTPVWQQRCQIHATWETRSRIHGIHGTGVSRAWPLGRGVPTGYAEPCKNRATKLSTCSSVQFSSVAQSCLTLRPHESKHTRPPCPSPTPGVHLDSRPSSW